MKENQMKNTQTHKVCSRNNILHFNPGRKMMEHSQADDTLELSS